MLGLIPYPGARYYPGYGHGVHVQSMLHEFVSCSIISLNIFIRLPTSKNAYKWLSKTKTYRYIHTRNIKIDTLYVHIHLLHTLL